MIEYGIVVVINFPWRLKMPNIFKERRQLNIQKDVFDALKQYCENNALNMHRWIEMKILEFIKKGNKDGYK